MSAAVHLILGPADADRTSRLIEAYRAAEPGPAAFLTPTRQHAASLREQILGPAVLPAQVFDLQSFADEIVRFEAPALRPLSDVQERFLVETLLDELRDNGELGPYSSIAETRGFVEAVVGTIAEFKSARTDLRLLLKAGGRRSRAGDDSFQLAFRAFQRYQHKLSKLSRLDADDRLNRAAELWLEERRGPFNRLRAVFVDGFTAVTASERALLDSIRDTIDHLWLALPDEEGEDRAEAFTTASLVKKWVSGPVREGSLYDPAPALQMAYVGPDPARPAGLKRLSKWLFHPSATDDVRETSGLHLIAAPGAVGEVRLVARSIRRQLAEGTPAERIFVVARTWDDGDVDLVREVFDEYEVPHEPPGGDALARVPVVAFLLRASRIAEEDWPFAGVSAVLRSGYFRPVWPELEADPEVPSRAEALLRMLGERRSREAYLAAVRLWEHTPPLPLEDEAAEASHRQRLQTLAGRCRPFLERFFRAWDRLKPTGSPDAFLGGLKAFADDLGLAHAAADDPRDRAGLDRFWEELGRWASLDHPAMAGRKPLTPDRFARVLSALTAVPCLPRKLARRASEGSHDPRLRVGITAPDEKLSRRASEGSHDPRLRVGITAPDEPAGHPDPRWRVGLTAPDEPAGHPDPRWRVGLTCGVRVLAAEDAVGLPCDVLYLTGLGEGSWPRLASPESLLDDEERKRLRRAGIKLADPEGRLGAEQLLFLQLVSQPSKELVLSYTAVDEKGQPLLPSTFLRDVLACFADGALATTRQRMPIEGYFAREALSPAERRVQLAHEWARKPGPVDGPLPSGLLANLNAARLAADARFQGRDFGPYDGELRHPAVTADLAERFASSKVFSPTALEAYVTCPFKFWLERVLQLEPLDDPAEEIEHTRRGSAFHRALARLHRGFDERVKDMGAEVPESVRDELKNQIEIAVEEYAQRSPSSATRELWRLEGQRLKRAAGRYRDHWQAFREPWQERGACPRPHAFEAGFGLPEEPGDEEREPLVLSVGGVEVRIGGKIDRVDVADLGNEGMGFWVIDYKTGRATSYSASQVARFEKLQLPLYALAVERVLFKDQPVRPLGLAYWLVTDSGPKPMLPGSKRQLLQWLVEPGRWPKFREQLEAWVAELVGHIRAGDFPLAPRSEKCTERCGLGPVCRISQGRGRGKPGPLELPTIPVETATEEISED